MESNVVNQQQTGESCSSPVVPSEEDIVRTFYHEHSSASGGTAGNEITIYKYIMSSAVPSSTLENPWVDGKLFSYTKWKSDWSTHGIKVKFYVMGAEYNLELKRKEVYVRVDEMMKLPGCSCLMTPLFATYNSHIKRVIVCYPDFDRQLTDWLSVNKVPVAEHTLPPIWNNLIRALIHCIPTFEKLKIRKLEDKSSYVWIMKTNEIRAVLFPEDEELDGRYLRKLATFIRECLYGQWKNADLLSFILMLESSEFDKPNANLQCITSHPLLQDFDSLSILIRSTWRSSNVLSQSQMTALNNTIICTKWGQTSWKALHIQDRVLTMMLGNHSPDAAGLFAYVKEISAHYLENYRKHYHCLGQHPISRIKICFPGLVSDIYNLSLNENWLTR